MGLRARLLLMRWNHASDVNFVSDDVVDVQRLEILTPELEDDLLPPAQSHGQRQAEETRRTRSGMTASQGVDGSDLDIGEWRLLVGVAVLQQDDTAQCDRLPTVQQGNGQCRPENDEN